MINIRGVYRGACGAGRGVGAWREERGAAEAWQGQGERRGGGRGKAGAAGDSARQPARADAPRAADALRCRQLPTNAAGTLARGTHLATQQAPVAHHRSLTTQQAS